MIHFDISGEELGVFLTDKTKSKSTDSPLAGNEYVRVLKVTNVNYSSIFQAGNVIAGFTAATGGLNQQHDILDWRMWSTKR